MKDSRSPALRRAVNKHELLNRGQLSTKRRLQLSKNAGGHLLVGLRQLGPLHLQLVDEGVVAPADGLVLVVHDVVVYGVLVYALVWWCIMW